MNDVLKEMRSFRWEGISRRVFDNPDVMKVNFWLPMFISEFRKLDRKPYPPKSIHQLLAGLQRYMLERNLMVPKFLDSKDAHFCDIHGAGGTLITQDVFCAVFGVTYVHVWTNFAISSFHFYGQKRWSGYTGTVCTNNASKILHWMSVQYRYCTRSWVLNGPELVWHLWSTVVHHCQDANVI